MLVLSENWVRLLTAMIAIDGTVYTVEVDELEGILEEYTSFPSSILTDILKEMPLQLSQLDALIQEITSEHSPKEVLYRISLLYKIAVVEGPLIHEENDILTKTISSLLGLDAVDMTFKWLEQQRMADIQLQAILDHYKS
jgi:uncharacterized tellurite resistance protein B-like protein